MQTLDRETSYLEQKGYIDRPLIQTASISAFSCCITAQGIDLVESARPPWGILLWVKEHPLTWLLIVVVPVLFVYRDNLLGVKDRMESAAVQGPTIFATPISFGIYKPSDPQVSGQVKAKIKVKVTNQGGIGYLYNIHVVFLTDDGTGHKTNSDTWNAQMGTKSLYTLDSLGPLKEEEMIWRPDIPSNAEQLYKAEKAMFRLTVYIAWQDRSHKRFSSLSLSELKYNRELNAFIFETKDTYSSVYDKGKIDEYLTKEWAITS